VAQTASQSFDISVWQMMAGLAAGGRVRIVGEERAKDPQGLTELIEREGVTVVEVVPSLLRMIVEEKERVAGGRAELSSVRWMLVTGEAVEPELCERWKRLYPEVELMNAYGPTECSDDVTHYRIDGLVSGSERETPIGRPIRNLRVYVMDEGGEPAAVGVGGEICVGGVGVGRGYRGEAERVAEVFIPDGVSGAAGGRLYRTGDIGSYLGDGRVEFRGRGDQQVKVRGYRIELGEIEAALRGREEVSEAVVMARGERGGDKRLVAYLVGDGGVEIGSREMRKYLEGRLPEQMRPSEYVWLEKMPLTGNGKVDRKALPEAGWREEDEGYEGPETAVEEIVAGIWESVMKRERVSVEENFFELGGHSLMATQVMSRLREAFKVEMPLRMIFEKGTVREMAREIERGRGGKEDKAPRIERVEREGVMELSYAQQRLWFLNELEPGSPMYNIASAVRLRGEVNIAALEQAIGETVRRHEILRTTFRSQDGRPVQVIGEPDGVISLPVADLTEMVGRPESEIKRLVREKAERVFDLSRGPLLNVELARLSKDEYIMIFVVHHIVADGWSTGVLVRDVTSLYEAYSKGEPSPLPELAVQYADYAYWQRGWMKGEVLEEGLRYWRGELSGELPALQLPTDRPRPEIASYKGADQILMIPSEIVDRMKSLSREEGATIFMALMAAFDILAHKYTGLEDITVATVVAGRVRAETEGLIGMFINMLPMRVDLRGKPSYRELLKRAREVVIGAFGRQEIPIEKIVEELKMERNNGEAPLLQVGFSLDNTPEEEAELPGLELTPFQFDYEAVRFDLTVWLKETSEGMRATWTYRTELYDSATITRMHRHFVTLLGNIAASPDAELTELEILTDEEKQESLAEAMRRQQSKHNKLLTIKPEAIRSSP
jgi:non-ribosomal peptide synthetase component F/acyl carrier protein